MRASSRSAQAHGMKRHRGRRGSTAKPPLKDPGMSEAVEVAVRVDGCTRVLLDYPVDTAEQKQSVARMAHAFARLQLQAYQRQQQKRKLASVRGAGRQQARQRAGQEQLRALVDRYPVAAACLFDEETDEFRYVCGHAWDADLAGGVAVVRTQLLHERLPVAVDHPTCELYLADSEANLGDLDSMFAAAAALPDPQRTEMLRRRRHEARGSAP